MLNRSFDCVEGPPSNSGDTENEKLFSGEIPSGIRHMKGPRMDRAIEYIMRNLFEPGLQWTLNHPIISIVIVGVLIYWAVRGYRML
jgi:hypothetical protein